MSYLWAKWWKTWRYTHPLCYVKHRRRKRVGGGQGASPPIIWEGGANIPFAPLPPPPPPNNPPTFSFNFYVKQENNHKYTKLKGKIIINVTLIWFEGTGKTIPLNSILEFSVISDFKMRNVIIWHWFFKNLVGTWRRNDIDVTSLRRIYVVTTSCACWEFGPPLAPQSFKRCPPPNILNLAPPPPIF